MKLCTDLPNFDTVLLRAQWGEALQTFYRLNELSIPCAMGLGVRQIIFQTVRAMGAKSALDIGTYVGTSALTMALAVGVDGRVVSVDINDVNGEEGHWVQAGRERTPRQTLELAGVSDRVTFVQMDSVQYLENTDQTFDFICIDGWHEDFAVYREIPLAISRLNDGGLIFMDDIQTAGPPPGLDHVQGPWMALERHLMEGLGIEASLIEHDLNGEPVAVAFLTRKKT